jgi:hypothetical protein
MIEGRKNLPAKIEFDFLIEFPRDRYKIKRVCQLAPSA